MNVRSLIYRFLAVPALHSGARLIGFFRPDIAEAYRFRREWRAHLHRTEEPRQSGHSIHVHVASAGEYEQAMGIVHEMKQIDPELRYTLSFSSLSGYRHVKEMESGAELIAPLPLEHADELDRFLDLVDPSLILFIRYDLWPLFLEKSAERSIPMVLACAQFRDRMSLPLRGVLLRKLYRRLSHVSAVDAIHRERIARVLPGLSVTAWGDSRLARVLQRAESDRVRAAAAIERVSEWADGRSLLVAGSTWEGDEQILSTIPLAESEALVIVPHVVSDGHIERVRRLFPRSTLLSDLDTNRSSTGSVLVVDRLGILTELYGLARLAWVGGGFGAGVHSVAEPVAHDVPVLCGPRIEGSYDASRLVGEDALTVVISANEAERHCRDLMENEERYASSLHAIKRFKEEMRDQARGIAAELMAITSGKVGDSPK